VKIRLIMTVEGLKSRIAIDIAENPGFQGSHDITRENVAEYLLEPFLETFVDFRSEKFECWVVLNEIPGGDGYLVVYNESEDLFGLGTKTSLISKEHGLLIAFYGPSFVDAIENM
jgi:hypothetical protein